MYRIVARRDRLINTALYLLYFIILAALYIFYVNPVWAYTGFSIDISVGRIATGAIVALGFALLTPTRIDSRTIFLNLLLTVYLIPSLVLYGFSGRPTSAAAVTWAATAIVYIVSAIPVSHLQLMRLKPHLFMQLLAFATVSLILSFYIFGGFRYFNLDLSKVYEVRDDAADALPGAFPYLASVFSKIVVPIGIVTAIIYRQYTAALAFFAAGLFLFGLTSHKGMLFYPIFAVVVFYALSWSRGFYFLLLVFICGLIISSVDAMLAMNSEFGSNWGWFASLFVRRGLLVPALLDYYHIEFFSSHSNIFWADSRLTLGLLRNPYGLASPYVIGEAYFGSSDAAANTGFIGSGFSQARILGTLLYSIGVGLTLALINAHGRHQGVPFVTAVMTSQVLTMFLSTDFVTLFLTHGVLVSFLLLGLISKPESLSMVARKAPLGRRLAPVQWRRQGQHRSGENL
jgi:hypothetical protein